MNAAKKGKVCVTIMLTVAMLVGALPASAQVKGTVEMLTELTLADGFLGFFGPVCKGNYATTSVSGNPGDTQKCPGNQTLAVDLENDTYASNTDDQYTNGVSIQSSLGRINGTAKSVLRFLRLNSWADSTVRCDSLYRKVTRKCMSGMWALVQSMYTPTNRTDTTVNYRDRPYAGVLVLKYTVRQQTPTSATEISLGTGVLGPSSKAEWTQTFIHRNLSHTDPFKGWRNQMPDEALVTAEVTQRNRDASKGTGWGFDGTNVYGGVLGNLMDYAREGGQVRFGYGLSAPWGDQRITQSRIDAESAERSVKEVAAASPNFEVALLAEGEARAVFYNATIDRAPRGLQSSWAHHSPAVLEGGVGASLRVDLGAILCSRFPDLETSYRYIVRSRELTGATLVDSLTGTHRYGVLRVAAAKHF